MFKQHFRKTTLVLMMCMGLLNATRSLGQSDEALKTEIARYSQEIQHDPKDDAAYYNRGTLYFRRKEYELAKRDFDKALQINAFFPDAYNNRGTCKSALKDYQSAIEDFSQAITQQPQFAVAYNNRAMAHLFLKAYQAAVADGDAAIRQAPNVADYYNVRGKAHFELKQCQQALDDYDKALQIGGSAYRPRHSYREAAAEQCPQTLKKPQFILWSPLSLTRGLSVEDLDSLKTVTTFQETILLHGKVTAPNGIQSLVLQHNGQSVFLKGLERGQRVVSGDSNEFERNVALQLGENSFEIKATDKNGKVTTISFLVFRQKTEPLPTAEKRLALVIGNSKYQPPVNDLAGVPLNDARDMKIVLERLGFKVLYAENTSDAALRQCVQDFAIQMKPYQVGLVYYAGHGCHIDGQNYWMPINVTTHSEVKAKGLSVDVLENELRKYGGNRDKTYLLIADACRNESLTNDDGELDYVLKRPNVPSEFAVWFAVSRGQVAGQLHQNGIFTALLLKYIELPISLYDLSLKVANELPLGTQQSELRQNLSYKFFFKKR